jgi:FtsP/CotA-like multicopper oxidase with cupredoxin domain
MKRNTRNLVALLAILFVAALTPSASADLFSLTDVNPDPNIFECDLTAIEKDVTIGGATVHAFNFKDENAAAVPASAGIPILVIKVKVGDEIICRFKNELTMESASIHWHGIELDNDSDGTAVTQDAVLPGQRYTYNFKTFRPGLFWFHSHMLPGNTLFGGMYGVIIIENPIEASLVAAGTLPADADTFTLAMSDIGFDPATGNVGKQIGGAGPYHTENELIAICHLWGIGDPGGMMSACNASTIMGSTVLVNGQTPDAAAQTPKFIVPSGKRIRLRLFNESISRHFRLKLLNSGDNKLYRIGGQGGLLDNVILEGGTKDTWNTLYDPGEILIGSGMRADVLIYPTGSEGSIIQLVGNPTTGTFQISASLPANYPVAYFQISGSAADPAPAAGDPILEGTAEDIENIKSGVTITPLVDPAPFSGSSDETIRLTTDAPTGPPSPFTHTQPGVDQYAAVLDSNAGNGDWLLVPRPPVARYANVGDILELTVRNDTNSAHPYHLHGFSMQPVRMIDNASGTTLFDFNYDEFLDTIDVYGHQSYVFRTRIDDRPKICDEAPGVPPDSGPVLGACTASTCGGVVGRWLFHCHIVSHGALGMIGEVTILPGVDDPPQITCPDDITQDNDPTLCSAVVTFPDPVATDDCGTPTVVCGPASGSVFPVGDTTVTCTATDSSNQTADCTFHVTVEDKEPPTIASSVAVPMLWPPNHTLRNVGLSATATDNCPGAISFSVAVFGDEDDELPVGDGNFSPDAKNVAIGTLRLRAERVGSGDGRVYLIVITATDAAGNTATACHTVVVPKSPSQAHIASVNSQAAAAQAYCIVNGVPPPEYVIVGDGPVIGPKLAQVSGN